MRTLSKSLLAITGLALSVACAPAFKGEGGKKPNLQRLLKAEEKALQAEASQLAHVKKVKRNKTKTEKGYKFTLTLENVPDLKKKNYSVDLDISEPNDRRGLTLKGKHRIYTLEMRCLDNCEKLAAVLTSEPRTTANADEDSAYAEDQEVAVDEEVAATEETDQAKEEAKEEKSEDKEESKESKDEALEVDAETAAATTAGTEAPSTNFAKLMADVITQTGVIADAKENKILTVRPLDPKKSFEEQIQVMQGLIVQKQMLKMK